jgi:hypothetical protein
VLLAGSHVCKSILEEELEVLGRQPVICNPLASFTGEDLRHTTTSDGNVIWKESDPVHLTEAAYDEWGLSIISLWKSAEAGGRRRIASIIEEERRSNSRGGGRGGGRGRGGQAAEDGEADAATDGGRRGLSTTASHRIEAIRNSC